MHQLFNLLRLMVVDSAIILLTEEPNFFSIQECIRVLLWLTSSAQEVQPKKFSQTNDYDLDIAVMKEGMARSGRSYCTMHTKVIYSCGGILLPGKVQY